MRVSSDIPISIRDEPALWCPSQAPESQLLDREYAIDEEFPSDFPLAYDEFLQRSPRHAFRLILGAIAIAITLLLLGFSVWKGYNLLTLTIAFAIVFATVVMAMLWRVAFSSASCRDIEADCARGAETEKLSDPLCSLNPIATRNRVSKHW
jgi:hypothetical protein